MRIVFGIVLLIASTPFATNGQVLNSFTEPYSTNEIAASEAGIVTQVVVKEGDAVKKGQLLAKLNSEVLQKTLKIAELRAQSKSSLRYAKATVDLKKKNYETLKPLLESGHANPAEVEQAQAALEAAIAEWEIAKEKIAEQKLEVERIKAQIKQRSIHSPVHGTIVEIHRRNGESIAASEPRFATIVQLDQLRVRFYLKKSEALKLAIGEPALVQIDRRKTVKATIEFVSPVIDPKSGTARVDVLLENRTRQFQSGTPCQWLGKKTTENLKPSVITGTR